MTLRVQTVEPVVWGCIGGLLGNLLLLLHHASLKKEDRPALLSDPWFWIGWIIEATFGVILTLAYLRTGVYLPPVAINIGASAPLIVEKLLSSAPAIGKAG
jgi:hypothetical protein